MKRGEIRYYEFASPDKRRPVLLLSRDTAIRQLNDITVAPITSTIRNLPTEVPLDETDGMPKRCAINLDHLQTVPKHRIGDRLTESALQNWTPSNVPCSLRWGSATRCDAPPVRRHACAPNSGGNQHES